MVKFLSETELRELELDWQCALSLTEPELPLNVDASFNESADGTIWITLQGKQYPRLDPTQLKTNLAGLGDYCSPKQLHDAVRQASK